MIKISTARAICCGICVVGAIGLMFTANTGWGWLLLLAFFLMPERE